MTTRDNIKAAIDALIRASYDDDGLELKPLKDARARLDALIGEVVAERDRYYTMAIAMFYSGKVDNLTGAECREAAAKIQAMIAAQEQPR